MNISKFLSIATNLILKLIHQSPSKTMKIVLQRVTSAYVMHESEKISSINNGYVLLVGVERNENAEVLTRISKKILKAKLFETRTRNIVDMNYEILILSQFTLFAKFKGAKPDFHNAETHERAKELFFKLCEIFEAAYSPNKIKRGVFGKRLKIYLVNDGPFTVVFEEKLEQTAI